MNSTLSGMHNKDFICPLVYREFSLESLFYIHLSLCKVVVKICTQTMRSPRICKMHSFEIVHLFGRVLKASDPKTPAPLGAESESTFVGCNNRGNSENHLKSLMSKKSSNLIIIYMLGFWRGGSGG